MNILYTSFNKFTVNPNRVDVSRFLHCCDDTIFLSISRNNLRSCGKRFIRLEGIGKRSAVP